jgi:hypothetical protein
MYNHKAAYSLRTYFKYLPTTEYIFRDSTSLDWDSILVSHLDRSIPMYYAGWSIPNVAGHAFVCDGYQDTGYYHFNFGWSGNQNGYFYTDNLNPGGSNFNLAQEVIVNAVPDTLSYEYPVFCQDTVVFNTSWGTLEDGSGPLYQYLENNSCHWLIDPDDSVNFITLEILRFKTSPGDTLYVYDGTDDTYELLGAFSGDTLPDEIISSGTEMFIRFVTDNNNNEDGWLAYFYGDTPVYCSGITSYTEMTDTISDGSGIYDYQNETNCLWLIEPESAGTVTLFFNYFETEEGIDNVEIYDKESQALLAEYSGSYPGSPPPPVTSQSGKMLVVFQTNYTLRADGWEAYYVSDYVGIDQPDDTRIDFMIAPVPAKNKVRITINKDYGSATLNIYNLTGEILKSEYVNRREHVLEISDLPPGIYLIELHSKLASQTKKLVVF